MSKDKNFEDLTPEELNSVEDLWWKFNDADLEKQKREFGELDWDGWEKECALEEEKRHRRELKALYYGYCLKGKQNPSRVTSIIDRYNNDEELNKDIQKLCIECLSRDSKQEKITALSKKIDELETKLINKVDFSNEWFNSGRPQLYDINALCEWVDEDSFDLFVCIMKTLSALKQNRDSLENPSEKMANALKEKNEKTFNLETYSNTPFILEALEAVGITDRHVSTLGKRTKSALMGFVEACLETNVLPKISKDVLCKCIAKYINLSLERRLDAGSKVANETKNETKDYIRKHFKRASSGMTDKDG